MNIAFSLVEGFNVFKTYIYNVAFIFSKTEIATGVTFEVATCTQDTTYLCCEIDTNSANNPCNKVISCANPVSSTTVTCDPDLINGDYMCQVIY